MTQRKEKFQAENTNENPHAYEAIEYSWASLSKAEKRIVKYRNTNEARFQAAVLDYKRLASAFGRELEQICLHLFLELDQLDQLGSDANIPLSHQRYLNAINNISQRLVREIVSKESVELATLCLERLAATAIDCFNHKNYQAAFIIIVALDDAAVSRLTSTIQGLSAHCIKKLNEMRSLLNPGIHRKKRGILIKNREGAIVPPIEYFKFRYHQIDLNIENLNQQLAEALEPKDAAKKKKINEQLNVLKSALANAIEADDPVNAEKINKRISRLNLKMDEAAKPVDPVMAKKISEQIAEFVLHKNKLTETISVMQNDLQATGVNNETEDHFFKLQEVTHAPAFTVNDHDNQTYAASFELEPRENRPATSTLFSDYPDMLLATNTRLHLDKKVKERLKYEKFADEVTHINMKIADLLTSLRAKPILGLNRKHTVKQVKEHLQEMEDYVKTRAVHGCIGDIDEKIALIDGILADNPFVYSYLPKRVSLVMNAMFGLSAGHVDILQQIKKLLLKEKKLQQAQRKLEIRFEKYHTQKLKNAKLQKKALEHDNNNKPDNELPSSAEETPHDLAQSTSSCVVSQADKSEVNAAGNNPLSSSNLNVVPMPESDNEASLIISDRMDQSEMQAGEIALSRLFSPSKVIRHTHNMVRSKSFLSLLTLFESMEKLPAVREQNEGVKNTENMRSPIMRKISV